MTGGGEGTPTLERRTPSFATEADAAADVRRLRQGYRRVGSWSLPQTCNHLAGTIERSLAERDPSVPVPAVDPGAQAYMETVLTSGRIPSGRVAPPIAIPPDPCDDGEIDRLLASLGKLERCDRAEVLFGRFGVIPLARARWFHLVHAAHHLGHLVPT